MERKSIIKLMAVGLLLMLLTIPFAGACAGEEEAGEVRIGVAFSTGGPGGKLGGELLLGTQLAAKYYNEELGGLTVDGKKYQITLVEYNSNTNPQEGVSVIRRLIEVEKVSFIIGDCLSSVVVAQQPVVEDAKWPWIMCAAHPGLTAGGYKYTHRANMTDPLITPHWWEMAMAGQGSNNKMAILSASTDYAKSKHDSAAEWATKHGAEIIAEDHFALGAVDFYPVLTKFKEAAPDFVYMPSYGEVATAIKQAAEIGFKTQWYTDDTVPSTELGKLCGEDAIGVRITTQLDPNKDTEGAKTYRRYISEAQGPAAIYVASYALGWDAAIRAFKALELANTIEIDDTSRENIVQAIKKVNWVGVVNQGSFDETGQIDVTPYILEVTKTDGTCVIWASK